MFFSFVCSLCILTAAKSSVCANHLLFNNHVSHPGILFFLSSLCTVPQLFHSANENFVSVSLSQPVATETRFGAVLYDRHYSSVASFRSVSASPPGFLVLITSSRALVPHYNDFYLSSPCLTVPADLPPLFYSLCATPSFPIDLWVTALCQTRH